MEWATPTPFPTPDGTPVIFLPSGMDVTFAESLVQGYQSANNAGALDMLMFAILFLIVVGGIWSVIHRVQNL